jgi:molybdopterin/thiamine biosynthesis adenylyltransferase
MWSSLPWCLEQSISRASAAAVPVSLGESTRCARSAVHAREPVGARSTSAACGAGAAAREIALRSSACARGGAAQRLCTAAAASAIHDNPSMNDDQLLRYSRHILLEEIGVEGQERLLAGSALVIGAGGLGSPVALYLGTAGVGRITLVDDDKVDLTNLQRQLAHTMARVGESKAESARQAIAAINPEPQVQAIAARADDALLDALVPQADVVVDCTDNFRTRHAINAACVRHRKPLVSGAAIRFDGQLGVYDTRDAASPCYACLFAPDDEFEETRCATMGVFAPLVGIIGAMEAAEALKVLSGAGSAMVGRLQMLDARSMEWHEVRVPRDAACPVCGERDRR